MALLGLCALKRRIHRCLPDLQRLDNLSGPHALSLHGAHLGRVNRGRSALELQRVPHRLTHLWLATAYAQLGQIEEARREAAEVLRINPHFTIERHKRIAVYKDPRTSSTVSMGCARRAAGDLSCGCRQS